MNKQETLEEAGVAYSKIVSENHTSHMLGFYNGAKWQQEQVIKILKDNDYTDEPVYELLEEWFEKFKKK